MKRYSKITWKYKVVDWYQRMNKANFKVVPDVDHHALCSLVLLYKDKTDMAKGNFSKIRGEI